MGPVDAYLDELAAALHGPRRAKADLLAEAADGLLEATEAYQAQGRDRAAAERAAVRDFGTLDEVVPGFQAELGVAQGRHTALLVLAVFGAQPFIWDRMFRWVNGTSDVDSPAIVAIIDQVVESLGGVTILVAMLAVLTYRIGMRHPGVRVRLPRVTGICALAVSVTFVALGILLGLISSSQPAAHTVIHLMWMVTFLVLPVSVIAVSARRCLAMSRRVPAAARR